MRSLENILDEICTSAHEGATIGCIDRCSPEELREVQVEFQHLSEAVNKSKEQSLKQSKTKPD